MASRLGTLLAAFAVVSLSAQVLDDFSAGDWKLFSSTPGTLAAEQGRLHLKDSAEPPNWITASKVFEIDADRTPWFLVKVADVSDGGTVKLIRQNPYDKQVALQIDRPGVYAIDVRKEYGWTGSIAIETCLYATGDEGEITYAYAKYAAAPTEEETKAIAERQAGGNLRLQVGEFDVVPLFHSCGFYFRSPERPGLSASYRRQGGEWQRAFPPVHVPEDGMYRGSIVRLAEDTPYELRIVDGDGTVLGEKPFRTWRSDVPVARTIVLDETNFPGHLKVAESGTPDGWIKITAKEGFVLRNGREKPLIELYKRRYVLLEGLTLRGGAKEAISIRKCEHVRVVNCDIAGWGRTGAQRFDKGGVYYTEDGAGINWDTAILVSRSLGTVIERCYVHDPVSRANSWYYSHPAGPQAAGMDKPQSTVVRYNDFVGSDPRRWNDAIEGAGNFDSDGGFNRDADIYGNLMCFANDDAVEIDGGQINVRVFDNKFEGCLCGTSIQGCMAGPSYVFDNLMVNMGDERGLAGQTIKTSSRVGGPSAVSFILGNTCHGPSRDLGLLAILRVVAKNNIFAGSQAITGRDRSPQSECDYNLCSTGKAGDEPHGILGRPDFVDPAAGDFALRPGSPGIGQGVALPNFSTVRDGRVDLGALPFDSDRVLPARPLPVRPDRHQLVFPPAASKRGDAQTVRVSTTATDFSGSYRVVRNEVFDWFTVTPSEGVLAAGSPAALTVRLLPERMAGRRFFRGAFLVRFANGLSRPVMVYAETDFVPPVKPAPGKAWVSYLEAETPAGGKAYETVADPDASGGACVLLAGPSGKDPVVYRFAVPKDGIYYLVLRVKSDEPVAEHDSVSLGIGDGDLERCQLRGSLSWAWNLAAQNRQMSLICLQPHKLKAGEFAVRLAPRESIHLDALALTDDPAVFE